MSAPLYPLGVFGDETSLLVAFAIGIAFGFVLERAGFGSARKLVSQFYLDDLAVLKVMFGAIVTAMIGIWALATAGILDMELVGMVPTVPWPQVTGGLVLGFGFVVGGYCPGTSMVGIATGRLDALACMVGIAAGTWACGEAWPWIRGFAEGGDLGTRTLPGVLHLPAGTVVLLVTLMALGAFAGAEWVERRHRPTPAGN